MSTLDILFLADPAFPGGSSTALVHELAAARRAGLRVALRPVRTARLGPHPRPNPQVLAALAATGTPVLPARAAVHARLALVCHPYLLSQPPARPLGASADHVGLIAHHPPVDRTGAEQYPLARVLAEARDQFGREAVILPVSPGLRRVFRLAVPEAPLWEHDWPNLIDPAGLPRATPGEGEGPLVVGRHSRPDLLKWPDPAAARLAYPEDPAFEFRMLGVGPEIVAAFRPWPANWSALPFAPGAAGPFLRGLQAYAYYHSDAWIEAFGYNVLEALAAGLPAVLPPHFRENFGEAALYAGPQAAAGIYRRLAADPGLRVRQGELARRLALERHGPEGYLARFERLAGPPPRPRAAPRPPAARGPDRVLAITSNGVGLGHLSRQIAIATAQPPGVETVFFSLSKAVRFAEEAGFAAEYRAYHRQTGGDPILWNRWFFEELGEAIDFYRPDALVFDGNLPYAGMIDAFPALGGAARIWVRRGLWRRPDPMAAHRAAGFDQILEPRDIAAARAPGHEQEDGAAQPVPPVLSVPLADCLSRATARRLLDLPEEAEIVLLQLGAGSNFDMTLARRLALDHLLSDPRRHVVEILSPARLETGERRGGRHHHLTVFPAFLYHRAFDYAVSACGYNSFHEIVAGALPCLFVPNVAPEMDLQECRADHARLCGWGLAARADDPYALAGGLRRLSGDAGLRAGMAARMAAAGLDFSGAPAAAARIALAMRSVQPGRG